MIVPEEWLKEQENKKREIEIKKWQKRFSDAKNNKDRWREVYNSYLSSKIWENKKKEILERANYRCENCRNEVIYTLQVHHKTYARIGGHEKQEDLEALCNICHPKADKKREIETECKIKKRRYQANLHGFATKFKKLKEEWIYEEDANEIEKEFLRFKYKKYCEEHKKSHSRHLKIPDWFQEWVWSGEKEEELEYLDNNNQDNWFL